MRVVGNGDGGDCGWSWRLRVVAGRWVAETIEPKVMDELDRLVG